MFINIAQSFSYLWRINKYQQKIDMNLNHISLTAIILKCLGIVQSVSWFLHLCLTKQLSNEREIPCSRFLSQSRLLRWNKMLRRTFSESNASSEWSAPLLLPETEAIRSPDIVWELLLMKEIKINYKNIIWQSTYFCRKKCRGTIKFDFSEWTTSNTKLDFVSLQIGQINSICQSSILK